MVRLIVALFFALCVAIFAVINVRSTPIHYIFGVSNVPLVLIILGSACFGGLIVGLIGAVGHLKWRRERRRMRQYIQHLESQQPAGAEDSTQPYPDEDGNQEITDDTLPLQTLEDSVPNAKGEHET